MSGAAVSMEEPCTSPPVLLGRERVPRQGTACSQAPGAPGTGPGLGDGQRHSPGAQEPAGPALPAYLCLRAGRLISPAQALLLLLTGPSDVELRVQGSSLSPGPDK